MQHRPSRRHVGRLTALLLPALCEVAVLAQQETTPATKTALPAKLSEFSDQGVFRLYLNEDVLATIEFSWKPDGTFKNDATLTMAGQSVDMGLYIKCDGQGCWTNMSYKHPAAPATIEREGDVARKSSQKKDEIIGIKPNTVLFENMSPALMSQAVLQYDHSQGGKQQFPLFIVPNVVMEGSLEMQGRVERSIGGRDLTLTRYLYALPGVDIEIWMDDANRLCLADVPAQHAAYVRDGYEILRMGPETDPQLSSPQFDVVVQCGVAVPMRDGIELATDIYLPKADGPFPAVLVRTPYKKEMSELQARYYARRGYAFAVQDCRGRFGSPGTWEPFVNEPHDGYDTIEWLAGQSWCTGKVGMIGASYLGWVQWWAAGAAPPHLVTIVPNVSPPDPFYNIPYEYGVFFLTGAIWWADVLETEATADLSGKAMTRISDKNYHKLLRDLPVVDLDKKVLGKENPYWRKWIEHPVNDDYWRQASFLDRLENVRIPVFHQSGWFDGDGIGAKLNYMKMASHGHPHQKLVLGPWGHTPQAQRRVGDRDFGPEAIVDLQRQYLRWFDHWLKGVDNGIDKEPLVSLFVIGSDTWLQGDTYPLPNTRFEKWYLQSEGSANTAKGDGGLTRSAPPPDALPDRFVYDPGDPTLSPQFYQEPDDDTVRSVTEKKAAREAYHTKVTDQRHDILVYTSEPLDTPLMFAGPLSAVLYASSSARDTDWFMRVMEVEQGGKVFQLAEGKIRARFRNSTSEPELLTPGQVYEYQIDLWQTGITIPAGRRLRVEVASASFPLFSRNLNTGGHNEMETKFVAAEQTVFHNQKYPSHILLPVVQPAEEGKPKTEN